MRERAAVGDGLWQRHGGGQRNYSAHSGPADHKNLPDAGPAFVLAQQAGADEIGDICAGKRPAETQQDQECAEQGAVENQTARAQLAYPRQYKWKLEADQYKNKSVQYEFERAPHRAKLKAHTGRK